MSRRTDTDLRQELIGLAFDALTSTQGQGAQADYAPNHRNQLVDRMMNDLTQRGVAVNGETRALAYVAVNTMAGILRDNPNLSRNQAIRVFNDVAEGNDVPRGRRGPRN